jgi:hypothetical protein
MLQMFTEKLSFSEGRCSHGKLRKSDLLNQLWPLALPRIRAYPTFHFTVTDAVSPLYTSTVFPDGEFIPTMKRLVCDASECVHMSSSMFGHV